MRDIPQVIPEEEKYSQELRVAILEYVDRTVQGHPYLCHLKPDEVRQVETEALDLAQKKLKEYLAAEPAVPPNIQDLALLGAHAALKKEMPWDYYAAMPDVITEDLAEMEETEYERTVQEMESIIQENYKDKPEQFREAILHSFHDALGKSDFKLVRRGDDVVAF